METVITGRPPAQQAGIPLPAQAGNSPSAFAALFAGKAVFVGKQPATEKGPEIAMPSAEQVMEALEARPETINALLEQHPELEEAVMFIAEFVLNGQDGEAAEPEEVLEKMPEEKENIFTKLALALYSPEAKALADEQAAPDEKQLEPLGNAGEYSAVKAELPALEQLEVRFNELPLRDQQLIQQAAEKLQQAAGPLLAETLTGNEKGQAEEVFMSRLKKLTALLSKVLPGHTGSTRPEAALIAAAVAVEAPGRGNIFKEKQEQEMSRMEKLDLLFPEKPPEVRQLTSYLEQRPGAGHRAELRPPWLPQLPAGWMSPAAGGDVRAETDQPDFKHDLQQWQKFISGRAQPDSWVPKALQPSSGEQPEKQLAAFTHSLAALIKKQPPVSLTAETEQKEAFAEHLERILQNIRGEAGAASAAPAPAAGAAEPKVFQPNTPLVIQLPPASEGHQRQAEFVKQFQQTLGTMSAAQLKNGASYTIRLHPEYLGRLDVKLTKIEGQWTAQLITTSKGAQELVESSVHQLRHSFLQQNLQLERIEVAAQPDFYKGEQEEEQEEQWKPENMQEEPSEEEDHSFEDILQQLSVNERI